MSKQDKVKSNQLSDKVIQERIALEKMTYDKVGTTFMITITGTVAFFVNVFASNIEIVSFHYLLGLLSIAAMYFMARSLKRMKRHIDSLILQLD